MPQEPSTSGSRDEMITLRVSAAERAAIEEAAEEAGRTVSAHIRQAATDPDSARPRVPKVNRETWTELAPVFGNLNQLTYQTHRFRQALHDRGVSESWARRAVALFEEVAELVDELREDVQTLRRELSGAAPLELAAATLEDWRRAANTGRLEVDRERLARLAAELRTLSEELEGEG